MIRIIKASEAPPPEPHEEPGEFIDLADHVQTHLKHAREEATRLVEEARRQAAQIRHDAERQGRQQAEAELAQRVQDHVERQLACVLPSLQQAIDQLGAARTSHLKQCESRVVQLAAAIAARLIRRELQNVPDIPLELIREALQLATGAPHIKLRLAPEDHQLLRERLADLNGFTDVGHAEIVADPQVSRGGCIVQSEFGIIDQRFESQLARIVEELI